MILRTFIVGEVFGALAMLTTQFVAVELKCFSESHAHCELLKVLLQLIGLIY